MEDNLGSISGGIVRIQVKNSILKELFRKTIHMASAFIPLLLKLEKNLTLILLCIALVFYTISEILRLKGHNIPLVSKITEAAARKRDENKFVLGPVTLVVGIMITAVLYDLEYATIGIFSLAFGDGLASLFGKLFGRIRIPFTNGKTAAGSLTCFFAIYVSSFCVCGNAFVSLVLALVGMFLEVIPMTDFDNIVLPVVIGGLSKILLA